MYDLEVLADAGRAFQVRAVAAGNARSPSVLCRVVGTRSVDVDHHYHHHHQVICYVM